MSKDGTILLDDLETGGAARVVGVDLPPREAQRLMEMGLTIGAEIRLSGRAPLRYPVVIHVRGSTLSLREAIARAVRVQRADTAPGRRTAP